MIHRNWLALLTVCAITVASAQEQPTNNETSLPSVKALTMMAAALPCANVDKSIDFYTKGLGMISRGQMDMGNLVEAALMFPGGGAYLLLQHPKPQDSPLPTRAVLNRVVLIVPDLKALETQLKAAGYALKRPITEMAKYKIAIAFAEDPDGNQIELIQRL